MLGPCRGGFVEVYLVHLMLPVYQVDAGGVVLSGPSDATCGRRTVPPEGRAQPNVIPSLDQNATQSNAM